MARVDASITPAERDGPRTAVTVGAVIAALYFGRDIFIPIALAILLSFVLAPSVRKLHALGLGRIFPVLFSTFLAVSLLVSLGFALATQLRMLVGDLPRYEDIVTKKIASVRGWASDETLKGIEDALHRINRNVAAAAKEQTTSAPTVPLPRANPPPSAPVPVVVQQPALTPFEALGTMLSPLLHPLATAGIVVIFVVFILLQREDLRNRLIRLFGANDLQRTTEAINDGARRLSRYFITQSLVNAAAGLAVGIAAFLIGVPNPTLWGILFGCMRFVPYLGPIVGGVLPCLFASAVSPGWSVALWMAGTILVIELAVGQFLEPLLYGRNTGLSPVAVVMAATFWTVLWGPIGLLLSTPLTVCLVVVGRHVEQLEFLEVLLGDRPPLTAPETFYQRMLANDPTEVSDQAQECLKSMSLTEYYDRVVLPGLLLAQDDVAADRLSTDRQIMIRDATAEVIEDLEATDADAEPSGSGRWRKLLRPNEEPGTRPSANPADEIEPTWAKPGAILCVGGRGPLDDCPAGMLTQILQARGLGARAASFAALSKGAIDSLDLGSAQMICLSCLDGSSAAYLRFALRRIRRHAPLARVLIGAWWLQNAAAEPDQPHRRAVNGLAEPFSTTILDAARFCLAAASALSEDDLPAEEARGATMALPS